MIRTKIFSAMLVIALPVAAGAQVKPAARAIKAPSTVQASPAKSVTAAGESAADLGYLTADQLLRKCSQSDPSSSSYCFAYIAAVTDTARAYEIWLEAKEFCLPARVSQAETRRAFLTYLDVYPQQKSGQAASVVVNALKQTYPCG